MNLAGLDEDVIYKKFIYSKDESEFKDINQFPHPSDEIAFKLYGRTINPNILLT